MVEGLKPHVGGPVIGPGMPGVYIQEQIVAVVGDKCLCSGGSSPDEIISGYPGILINGKEIAIVNSMTQHGGMIVSGIPGVTIFPCSDDTPPAENNKPEQKVYNLQWRKEENITHAGQIEEEIFLTADTIGYEEGDEVNIEIFDSSGNLVDEVNGTVKEGCVEARWIIKDKNEETDSKE